MVDHLEVLHVVNRADGVQEGEVERGVVFQDTRRVQRAFGADPDVGLVVLDDNPLRSIDWQRLVEASRRVFGWVWPGHRLPCCIE